MIKENKTESEAINKIKYTSDNPFVYESNYFYDYFRAIPFRKTAELLKLNNLSLDNKTILIVGCGCGIDAHYLKKYYKLKKICFTDINMIAMEKTSSNFHDDYFLLTDTQKMALKDNSFDYVFTAESLHHLKEPIKGLYELVRIAKEGVIVIEPHDSWLIRLFIKLGLAHEYETEHDNYVYRFKKSEIDKISKSMLLNYGVVRFFSIHSKAKTTIQFLILKAINNLANIICPNIGNYIIFVINKAVQNKTR